LGEILPITPGKQQLQESTHPLSVKDIVFTISFICKRIIGLSPILALFGVVPADILVTPHQADAVAFITLLARRLIVFSWKKSTPPSFKRWVEEVGSHLKLEYLV